MSKWGSKRWHIWVTHAVIAALGTFLFSLVISPLEGAVLMAWAYLFREVGQQIEKKFRGQPIHWRDAGLDALAPAVAAALVAWPLT